MKAPSLVELDVAVLLPPVDGNCALELCAGGVRYTKACELTAEMITADVKVALVNIIANIDNVRIVVR